jgi:hypothetical protein
MGAELYKNLSNYFIAHLTEVRAVSRIAVACPSSRLTPLDRLPKNCKTSLYCNTIRTNGAASRKELALLLVCSPI